MSFDWSKHQGAQGESVKFINVGDSVTGHIVNIREHQDDKKGVAVLMDLNTGGEEPVTLWCDKVDLRPKIAALEPQIGDKIRVTYTGNQKTPNGTMKIFEVKHKVGERPAVAPAPPDDFDEPSHAEEYGDEPF